MQYGKQEETWEEANRVVPKRDARMCLQMRTQIEISELVFEIGVLIWLSLERVESRDAFLKKAAHDAESVFSVESLINRVTC